MLYAKLYLQVTGAALRLCTHIISYLLYGNLNIYWFI